MILDSPRIVNQSPAHNQNIFGESSLSEFRSCSIMGEDHPKMFLNANLEIGSQRNLINLVLVSTCDVNIPSKLVCSDVSNCLTLISRTTRNENIYRIYAQGWMLTDVKILNEHFGSILPLFPSTFDWSLLHFDFSDMESPRQISTHQLAHKYRTNPLILAAGAT